MPSFENLHRKKALDSDYLNMVYMSVKIEKHFKQRRK